MCQTGHSLIKAKMKQTKALLAGEMSGHIFLQINIMVLMMLCMQQLGY